MTESNPAPSPALPLIEELATIKNYLTAAQDVLKSGYMPDITGLEKRVADICQKIQSAPKEVHQQCVTELTKVLEALSDCEKAMRAFHEAQLKGKS